MLLQTNTAIRFPAFFTASGVGKTGLALSVDVYRDGALLLSGASATEGAGGLYSYTLAGASAAQTGNYIAIFKSTDTSVDMQHVPSFYRAGEAWVQNVDAAVSSRSTLSATQVWEYSTRSLTSFGTLVADVASAVWGAASRTLSAFAFPVALQTGEREAVRAGLATSAEVAALPTLSHLRAARITVQAPVLASGELGLSRGDAYKAADGRAIVLAFEGALLLAVAPRLSTVALMIEGAPWTVLGTRTTTSKGITCSFELSAAQTAQLSADSGKYFVRAVTTAGDAFDLAEGTVTVNEGSQ